MMKYICHFPNCPYETENRDLIELHHIVPKELGKRLNSKVTLSFCPTHHRMIYHPECKHGHHSINGEDKLQILGIHPCNKGIAVEYKDYNGNTFFELFDK